MNQDEQEFLNRAKKTSSVIFATGVGVFWLYRKAKKYINSDNKEVSKYAKNIIIGFWIYIFGLTAISIAVIIGLFF